MNTQYTTYGSVRGGCGHRHRNLRAAERCLRKDQSGCASQNGYSDRTIAEIRDGLLYLPGGDENAWIPGAGGRTSGAARI